VISCGGVLAVSATAYSIDAVSMQCDIDPQLRPEADVATRLPDGPVISVFGSVARGAAGEDSDVDLLDELRPGARLGWEIDDLADELSEIFGRPVDLVARVALHPMLAETVLGEAQPVYAA
jgi:uncharacterized protein